MKEANMRKVTGVSTSPNERLRNEREKRGWTREHVAEKIGSDTRTIGRWERGTTSPSPHYRQELCELFCMNAEELGFFKEEAKDSSKLHALQTAQPAETTNPPMERNAPPIHNSPPQQLIIGYRDLLSLIVTGIIIIVSSSLLLTTCYWKLLSPPPSFNSRSTPDTGNALQIPPGGVWINPANDSIVHDTIRFTAKAYPTHPEDPPINRVNFTIGWRNSWRISCTAYPPANDDTYTCITNLLLINAPAGHINVSFDVYDQLGNTNHAPNGVHTLLYKP